MFELDLEAVFNDRCTFCGACAVVCDNVKMDEKADLPRIDQVCRSTCVMCHELCPRGSLDIESIEKSVFGEQRTDLAMGVYKKIVQARSKDSDIVKRAQSGGFVSSLLISALEQGIIDCAIVTNSELTKDERAQPVVVDSKEGILAASGSKYTPVPAVLGLRDAIDQGYQKIGFVGLPCHIEGLRKLQTSQYDITGVNRVSLVIGLLCSKSYSYNEFMQVAKAEVGNEKIRKYDIKGSKFYIYTDENTYTIPLKNLKPAARTACEVCIDYSAELADLSAGSVGAPDGYSSVIIRSERGLQAFKSGVEQDYIEFQDMEPKDIAKIKQQVLKKRIAGFEEITSHIDPIKLMHLVVKPSKLRIEPLLE